MSKYFKNFSLLLILLALCFMIKCKLDNDSRSEQKKKPIVNSEKQISEVNTDKEEKVKIASQVVEPEIKKQEETVQKEEPAEKVVAKKEAKPSPAPQAKKKKRPTKKKTKRHVVKASPKIEFEELMWDFGEITEGDVIEKKFKFTNTGNAKLEILSTKATCGCTRPTFPFIDINPGESNIIGVKYHSVGKDGDQNPEITVESNTTPRFTIIQLKGTVVPKEKEKESTVSDSFNVKKDTTTIKN